MSRATANPPQVMIGCRTDIGRVRKMNQDSYAILEASEFDGRIDALVVVADGMGGKAGGEIASRVTVETVPSVVIEAIADESYTVTDSELGAILQEGFSSANDVVFTQGRANPELKNMGTTCVAAMLRGNHAIIAHVGDSRIYLCRNSAIERVTEDHSLVQEHIRSGELTESEAKVSRYRNMITRAIGIAPSVAPEIRVLEMISGDRLLLCSDGLTNMVDDARIGAIVGLAETPQDACEHLVELALENGGEDNVTVLITQFGTKVPGGPSTISSVLQSYEPLHSMPEAYVAPVRRRNQLNVLLLFLTLGLGVSTFMMFQRDYHFVTAVPYVKHNEPKVIVPPASTKLDLTHLEYADPVAVTPKALRGAPLACDGAGNLYGIALQSGAPVRITPAGKVTLMVASETAPAVAETGKHWAVDAQGNLYVSSRFQKSVSKYDPTGTRVGSFGLGKLTAPEAVAVDGAGNIYLVDGGKLIVMKALPPNATTPGATNGTR
ncbi:MAG: Stp1/IreP family PP2C-type Ser/Thr phosphatase [Chthonomonadales bacterium]